MLRNRYLQLRAITTRHDDAGEAEGDRRNEKEHTFPWECLRQEAIWRTKALHRRALLKPISQDVKMRTGIIGLVLLRRGACSSVVVKALCYKPEGRGFENR
jgi:hypothetical protein